MQPRPMGSSERHGDAASAALEPVRLDVWLWRARLVKSRSLAASLIESGAVRLERPGRQPVRVEKPAQLVAGGDRLSCVIGNRVVAVEVLGPGWRRGPPVEAQALYRLID